MVDFVSDFAPIRPGAEWTYERRQIDRGFHFGMHAPETVTTVAKLIVDSTAPHGSFLKHYVRLKETGRTTGWIPRNYTIGMDPHTLTRDTSFMVIDRVITFDGVLPEWGFFFSHKHSRKDRTLRTWDATFPNGDGAAVFEQPDGHFRLHYLRESTAYAGGGAVWSTSEEFVYAQDTGLVAVHTTTSAGSDAVAITGYSRLDF